ncbi:hypothetical protein INS49_001954 [Diaporthe citri]|uniref:uncharacterized protein n=1 Tax=Diaporthe citri TaxID=83186 RepID=UPI001C7E2398|nr:uncharacterized protein INS49_001954 [Diaporthe citri]KAG6367759.1 hypothetical protein INS49_001954 [Diaporthe citri]
MGEVAPNLDQLRQHLEQSSVPAVFPDAPEFKKLAQSYNRVFSYRPAAICLPEKDDDVVNAINSGGQDGSLILHMRNFSAVSLDTETKVAVVGAGVRLGQLATELFRQGKRAVPHGTIKNVGVAGHFSHGGYGYQSRAWGLAVDSICGLDVVLADGRLLHVTENDHPELFYAFRGAADSFGVILRFHLRTVPAPEEVVLFSYDIDGIVEDVDEAAAAFLNIQQVVQNANVIDRDLSFGFYIHNGSWTIWGVFLRDQDVFEAKMAPALLDGFKRPVKKFVQTMAWLDCLDWFSGNHSNDATEEAYDTFYAQSALIPEHTPLNEKVVRAYFETMRSASLDSSQSWYAVINVHGGPGSQITSVPVGASAYTHREMLWVIQHYGYSTNHLPPLLDSTKAVITRLTRAVRAGVPASSLGAEPNYHDPDMARDTAHSLHYGEAAIRRLEALKSEIDPSEVFWNPQSIRPKAN